MNRNKLRALVATGAAAAVLGLAGFAFAAFTQHQAASATGSAEQFNAVTVTAAPISQALLPGEDSSVDLSLQNPNTVKAKVVSISAASVTVAPASLNVATDAGYCESMIHLNPNGSGNLGLLTLNGGGSATYTLNHAVTLDEAMDSRCEGMQFTTEWTVEFQAVRA
jgi:hypothetical protein